MATTDTPAEAPRRNLSDYYTPMRNDDILESIEGEPVEIVLAEVATRKGRNGDYKVTRVTLADGRSFTVAGGNVGEAFEHVPPDAWPVWATFEANPSAFDADGVYWTVK